MLISCWSAKGGAGTSVVAASLTLAHAELDPGGAVLVDLAGDATAVLGVEDADGPGVGEWLAAGHGVPADGLARLEVPVAPGVVVLPPGAATAAIPGPDRCGVLAQLLDLDPRPVVVDCGVLPSRASEPIAAACHALAQRATHSWLITRACYLALRRAVHLPIRPSGIVLVREDARALQARDIEAVLDVPVIGDVPVDPSIARAIDAGLLTARPPRGLLHAAHRVISGTVR